MKVEIAELITSRVTIDGQPYLRQIMPEVSNAPLWFIPVDDVDSGGHAMLVLINDLNLVRKLDEAFKQVTQ